MKKVAVLADIHGNWPALQAVIEDVKLFGVNEIWCLGDMLGYGLFVAEILKWVNSSCSVVLLGNHEHLVLNLKSYQPRSEASFSARKEAVLVDDLVFETAEEISKRLTPGQRRFLKSLPYTKYFCEDLLILAHASFGGVPDFPYLNRKELAMKEVLNMPATLQLFGHTHYQFVFGESTNFKFLAEKGAFWIEKKKRNLVCVGSVGQPRDDDPRAGYLILTLGEDTRTMEFRRVDYDVFRAERAMREVGTHPRFANRIHGK